MTSANSPAHTPVRLFAFCAAAVTLLRVLSLVVSNSDLGPDEAQYWYWSQHLAFGYYSKPPLIAWAIAATTALFGDAEWAVRISSPIFHLGTSIFLFALARRLFDDKAAFWTGLGWLLLPGAALSAALITTDAPLLFFWSAGLFYFFETSDEKRRTRGSALLFGASLGFGLLSKYAMIYFPLGAVCAFALSADLRRKSRVFDLMVALVVMLAIAAPNLAWNAANKFATFSHTAANAELGRAGIHFGELLEFWIAQIGVFGPVLLVAFAWGVVRRRRRDGGEDALLMFAALPLLIVSVEALIARAHGNWAAVAYPSALLLTTAWLRRADLDGVLKAASALHAILLAGFLAVFAHLEFADAMGLSRAVKTLRGWATQIAEVRLAAAGADAVVVDDRELMGEVIFYARGGLPVYALNSNRKIDNHFEQVLPYRPAPEDRALFVDRHPDGAAARAAFQSVVEAGVLRADLGGGRARTLYLFKCERPVIASGGSSP